MLLSQFFLQTLKEAPKDAKLISHQLSIRAGLIRQVSSGLYNWLPLGLKVLRKIEQIVRQEMNNIGSNEVIMPTVQPTDLWKKSGRYGDGN
jgi:prolyl-tRNA synthetase